MNMQIYDEASEWIILHRSDDLDAEAKRRFDAWLRESPQHLRAYLEMSTIWEDVPALNHDWNPHADELIARARAEGNIVSLGVEKIPDLPYCQLEAVSTQASGLNTHALSPEPAVHAVAATTITASKSNRIQLLAAAAMLIVVVGITGLWYAQRDVYTTDTGEQLTVALTDGSTVELNAQTKIRISYSDDQRTVQLLRGQALFKVAKDPQRPFIVDSDGTRVRAVGTQFDVYKKASGTQITVVEGRVAVAQASGLSPETSDPKPHASVLSTQHSLEAQLGEVLLSAGEQILIAQNTPAPQFAAEDERTQDSGLRAQASSDSGQAPGLSAQALPVRANIEAATAWTQQRLVFDFSPLREVAHEFNRYNRRPLIIDDPALETFNISGSFSSTDPTLLLRFLREQPGIVVHETASEIRISRQDATNG